MDNLKEQESEVLGNFLKHDCDGFQEILVESYKPLTLIFHSWDDKYFRLVVDKIEYASREVADKIKEEVIK